MAASEALGPDDKELAKMTPAKRAAYKAKKQQEALAEKKRLAEKEALENPTVDENGEHIQTVAEAKEEARQLQAQLEEGERAVDEKIAMQQEELANAPPPEPVKQEEDDGHIETVEEVKARMAALQSNMDAGLNATEQRVSQMDQEVGDMPNFGALADLHSSISNMGKMRKQKQMQDLAAKLGVEVAAGEENLSAEELTQTLMQRAKEAGKSEDEINAAMEE